MADIDRRRVSRWEFVKGGNQPSILVLFLTETRGNCSEVAHGDSQDMEPRGAPRDFVSALTRFHLVRLDQIMCPRGYAGSSESARWLKAKGKVDQLNREDKERQMDPTGME